MPVELRVCSRCQQPFVAAAQYKSCLLCWKNERGYATTKADDAFELLQKGTAELQDKFKAVEQNATKSAQKVKESLQKLQDLEAKFKDAEQKLQDAERKLKKVTAEKKGAEAVPQELLIDMIKLCHPDSHPNSPKLQTLGTKVVKWLYDQRK